MKKEIVVMAIVFLISIFLILFIPLVSAGWFSDFVGKITGKGVSGCTDTDVTVDFPNGKNPYTKGIASIPGDEKEDYCVGVNRDIYYEAYCSFFGTPVFSPTGCPEGYACVDGACANCVSNCTGKKCGDDGCGGSCGSCEERENCVEGICTKGISCIDSDVNDDYPNGVNPYVKGNASFSDGTSIIEDSCGANIDTVIEAVCGPYGNPTTIVYSCPKNYICQEGICSFQEPECNDTDGLNFNVKGTCTKSEIRLEDNCISSGEHKGWLKEYYCFGNICDTKEYNCPYGCSNGVCVKCISNCTGKECGNDGCGGSCGSCEEGMGCINNHCVECSPNCTGKKCGDDGCGGSCGSCEEREICITNKCVKDCEDTDINIDYPDGKNPYIKGITTTKSKNSEIEDYCDPNYQDILKEAYCGSYGGTYYAIGCLNGCSEGHCIECSQNCTGKKCGDDGCGGSCGSCEEREICIEGQCSIRENEKNILQYSDKEVFLISDKDWKEALPLIPVTTWTGSEDCQKAYGTSDNICVYPTLIYHGEVGDHCLAVSDSDFQFNIFPNIDQYFYNGELIGNKELSSNSICPDEFLNLTFTFENIGTNDIYIGNLSFEDSPIQIQPLTETIMVNRILHPGNVEIIVAQVYYPYNNSILFFDADSIIYFMQQYSPEKVTIIGETPQELDDLLIASPDLGVGLEEENIQRISIENYLSYWEDFNDIVYVKDNYELALIASTYASLINAPLIIRGSILDENNIFKNKNIICVGDVNPNGNSCSEEYNLIELQEEYFQKTNTDKLILINQDDLEIKVEDEFKPEKSSDPINYLFNKNSLTAPILASAKHELLISTNETNFQEIDEFIEKKIDELQSDFAYLTILASPYAIAIDHSSGGSVTDTMVYAQLNDDFFRDIAVGRIYGFTTSDSSSYIARSLYYDKILKNNDKILITGGQPFIYSAAEVYATGKIFDEIGYETTTIPDGIVNPKDWKNKFYIIYKDHGGNNWAGIYSTGIPYLDSSFLNIDACSTCAGNHKESFCMYAIRKGAVGYIGAVSSAGFFYTEEFLSEIFSKNSTIGRAFINSLNSGILRRKGGFSDEYILLGDPTLKLKIIYNMPSPTINFIQNTLKDRLYKLTMPALKINIPEYIKNLCEAGSQIKFSPVFSTVFSSFNFETKPYYFNYYFDYPEGFEPIAASNKFKIFSQTNPKKMWLESPIKWSGYFQSANEIEFTNEDIEIKFSETAPEFIIENISLLNKHLYFDVKNIGNSDANVTINYYCSPFGCRDGIECHDKDWLSYLDIYRDFSLSLAPGEKQEMIIDWSSPGALDLSDYNYIAVSIDLNTPDNFIEINPDNYDVFWKVVENEN